MEAQGESRPLGMEAPRNRRVVGGFSEGEGFRSIGNSSTPNPGPAVLTDLTNSVSYSCRIPGPRPSGNFFKRLDSPPEVPEVHLPSSKPQQKLLVVGFDYDIAGIPAQEPNPNRPRGNGEERALTRKSKVRASRNLGPL